MRTLLLSLLLASLLGCPAAPLEYPDGAVALAEVDVAWMGDDSLLLDRRVVVHEGVILDVLGPDDAPLSDEVEVIARGGFVMPGLTDLHVHAWFESDLTLFVANGVTTVRNLFGDPLQLGWRDEIAAGERLGPRIITAGPIIDGSPPVWNGSDVVTTEAEGRAIVGVQIDAGYDLVKVYARLTEQAWRGVLSEAEARGVQAVGHVPASVTFTETAASYQSTIEHLDGLSEELAGLSWWEAVSEPAVTAALDGVSPAALSDIADLLVETGTWNVPTLTVFANTRLSADDLADRLAAPELAYVAPAYLNSWQATTASTLAEMDAWNALRAAWREWLLVLHQRGAPIGLGTDCGNAFVIAGFSVHEELRLLVEAGLSPYEALRAGTAGAAEAVERTDFGVVEAGRRADLLWLDANPLEDVANARSPAAVMTGGEWMPRDELDAALSDIAELYAR